MKEVDTDTLELLQHSIPLLFFTDAEAIEQAVRDLIHILKNPQKNNIPRVLVGDKIRNAFQEVAKILQRDNPNLPQTRINNSTQQSTTEIANPKKLCSSTQSAPKLQQRKKMLKTLFQQRVKPTPTHPPTMRTDTASVPRVTPKITEPITIKPAPPPRVNPLFKERLATPHSVSPDLEYNIPLRATAPTITPRSPFPLINTGNMKSTSVHPAWVAYHIFDEK